MKTNTIKGSLKKFSVQIFLIGFLVGSYSILLQAGIAQILTGPISVSAETAQSACSEFSGYNLSGDASPGSPAAACEQGYGGQLAGKKKGEACPASLGSRQSACNTGYVRAAGPSTGILNPGDPFSGKLPDTGEQESQGSSVSEETKKAIEAACKDKTGTALEQCKKDVLAQAQEACKAKTGDDKETCLKDAVAKAAENQVADCDTQLSSVLSWILCPLIDMASNTSDFIFKQVIKPLLDNSPVSLTPGATNGPYTAWQGFRFLGNILLIGAMLMLVYGAVRGGR